MADNASTEPLVSSGDRPSSSPKSLAWLVHSQDSISRSLPPDIDDKPLARQKRRRTSPEDQRLLEDEYRKNPRPDRATRAEIVKHVALGEKEVQIWFQNRRQNTRRKTQPLTTEEILHRLHSSSDSIGLPGETPSGPSFDARELEATNHSGSDPASKVTMAAANVQGNQTENEVSASAETGRPSNSQDSGIATEVDTNREVLSRQSTFAGYQPPFSASQDSTTSFGTKTGYLANRRNASFVHSFDHDRMLASQENASPVNSQLGDSTEGHNDSRRADTAVTSIGTSEPTLKRSKSALRLSMTLDGQAKIINNISPTPSPPRSQPPPSKSTFTLPRPTLHRSRSVNSNSLLGTSGGLDPVGRSLQRTSSGRSRDSRAWEFWCDSDARNSLAEKAEQERSGSAADAIGLMRSTSRTAASNASANRKRPLQPATAGQQAGKKRSKLSRAATVTGSLPSETRKQKSDKGKGGKEDGGEEFERPNTDSDKENWEPSNTGVRRAQYHASPGKMLRRQRTVLGENTSVPSQSSSLEALLARDERERAELGSPSKSRGSVHRPVVDEEVARFMDGGASGRSSEGGSGGSGGSGSGRTSVSSGEELDCVQGLLSLSQGIWK